MNQLLLKLMKKLHFSIYLALNNYQESYEFYRPDKKRSDIPKLKVIQTLWSSDKNDPQIAA